MREYEMETTFDVPLRTFLRLVYGDDGLCLRQYHASCGKCEDATVPAWDVSEDRSTTLQGVLGSRTIAFSKPMELPSVIERLLGPSAGKRGDTTARPSRASLSFTEKQTLEVEPVNGNVLVRSAASLDSRWVGSERAEKFNAVVEIAYASAADPTAYGHAERTAMAARITVNAAGAWALQPVVERVMEHRAVSAFREWVVWIDEYVSERAARTGETRLPPLAVLGLGEEDVLENVRDRDAEDANTGESDDERQRGLHSLRRDASVTNKTRKKYPATPGTSRRASLSVEDTELVETPPRDESLPSSSEKKRTNDAASVSGANVLNVSDEEEEEEETSDDDDVFDDAASSRSGASFQSARSARSSRSSRSNRSTDAGRAESIANNAMDDETAVTAVDPSSREDDEDDDDGDDGFVASPRTPRSAANGGSKTPSGVSSGPEGVVSSASRARLDDARRDGWFIQTVMNDLTALKTGAGETGKVLCALEERVRALAAEQARMKSELRRGGSFGGFGLDHRGDTDSLRSGGFGGWARWTAARARSPPGPGTRSRRRRGREGSD
jgi:hypothetical protein